MAANDAPIFIVGAPRSGTTLLQYMLRAHPRISLPTGESHYFIPLLRLAADFGDLGSLEVKKAVLAAMYRQSAEFLDTDLHGMRFDIDELAHEFQAQGRATMESLLAGVLERNARGEGKSRWGDKTPYYVLHMERLKTAFPDAQFIHLVRDGRDVALSLFGRRDDFHVYNVYCAAKYWQHYVEAGREQGQRLGKDAYLELRYEELIREPKAALQAICAFLKEEFLDELLNYKRAGQRGKTPLVSQPLQPQNREKWRGEFSRWQLFVFESVARDTLRACGYEPATQAKRPLPLPLRAAFRLHDHVVGKLRHGATHS